MATDLLSTISAEIDARLRELQSLLAEYEQLLDAAEALESQALGSDGSGESTQLEAPSPAPRVRKAATRARLAPRRTAPRRTETDETILGILEHGSHTVAELAVVTAMSTTSINSSLRRLLSGGAIAKTEREGKLAYALS